MLSMQPGACSGELEYGKEVKKDAAGQNMFHSEQWKNILSQNILPLLCWQDKVRVRSTCLFFRLAVNSSIKTLRLEHPTAFYTAGSWNFAKRFPNLRQIELEFNSPYEVKAFSMHLLTQKPEHSCKFECLVFREGRCSAQSLSYPDNTPSHNSYYDPHSYYPDIGRCQAYGYNSSSKPATSTLDFTEVLLAVVCSCPLLKELRVEKSVLLETEAAAISKLKDNLNELRLTTNCSSSPLRRPLVQLMLSNFSKLRRLRLSYIRDTTGDLANLFPSVGNLNHLELEYAHFGEGGAGPRIMAAAVKHLAQLESLHMLECCVDDEMLAIICCLVSLKTLTVQDEDAPEESCPSNVGLSRVGMLTRLERLELFGEELRLDRDLLAQLAKLPRLKHLAVARLYELGSQSEGGEHTLTEGAHGFDEQEEDMEMYSGADDEDTSSGSSVDDDVTSRPMPLGALPSRSPLNAHATASSAVCGMRPSACSAMSQLQQQYPNQQHQQRACLNPCGGAALPDLFDCRPGSNNSSHARMHSFYHAGDQGVSLCGMPMHGGEEEGCMDDGDVGVCPVPQAQQRPDSDQDLLDAMSNKQPRPLQTLPCLESLTLYGPSSQGFEQSRSTPPLALLLPQPHLTSLKLSASASLGNLRALMLQQRGLKKLILSHSSVDDLYGVQHHHMNSSISMSASAAFGSSSYYYDASCDLTVSAEVSDESPHVEEFVAESNPVYDTPALSPEVIARRARAAAAAAAESGTSGLVRGGVDPRVLGMQHLEEQRRLEAQVCRRRADAGPMCVLGFPEDVSLGLANLTILRIKDIPGFSDVHLRDLAHSLACLPLLRELKLRQLPAVGNAGLSALTGVTSLRRLKLYSLGDVTNEGIAALAVWMPGLLEIKVCFCHWVSPVARDMALVQREATHGVASALSLAVRVGPQECDKKPKKH